MDGSQPTYLINLKKEEYYIILYIYYNVKCIKLEHKKKEMIKKFRVKYVFKQRLEFPFVLKECLKKVSLSDFARGFLLELGHLHKPW